MKPAERRAKLAAAREAIRAYAPTVAGLDVALVADVHVDGPPRVSTLPRELAALRLREVLPARVLSDLEGLAGRETPAGHVLAIVPPFVAEHLTIAVEDTGAATNAPLLINKWLALGVNSSLEGKAIVYSMHGLPGILPIERVLELLTSEKAKAGLLRVAWPAVPLVVLSRTVDTVCSLVLSGAGDSVCSLVLEGGDL